MEQWEYLTFGNSRWSEINFFSAINIDSEDVSLEAGPMDRPLYMYLRISLPISVSLLALVLTLATAAICLRRSKFYITYNSKHIWCTYIFSFAPFSRIHALQSKQGNFKGKLFSKYRFLFSKNLLVA